LHVEYGSKREGCGDEITHKKPAGWILPVEPFLNPLARRDVWSDALTMVRIRAT